MGLKKIFYSLICILLLLVACQKEQVSISPTELARRDSMALHIGLMPVLDCLPIYYAQSMGMFNEVGLDVRLNTFYAQMDCDTALLRQRNEVIFTDLFRLLYNQMDSSSLCAIATTSGSQSLITAKKARIRTLGHLNERMIAIDRLSISDYLTDEAMRQAGLSRTSIYRPQINDINLRLSMLNDQLVDGAILPEPQATQAELMGHNRLLKTDSTSAFYCFAARQQCLGDTLRNQQIRQLLRIYDKAVDALNSNPNADTLHHLLVSRYAIPAEMADTIRLPRLRHITIPNDADTDKALSWLKSRECRISDQARKRLLWMQKPSNN